MSTARSRKTTVLAPFLLFLLCASAVMPAAGQIVGRWRSMETSTGGIGEMYEFHADGTIEYSPGAVVEMPWQIKNNELVLSSATIGGLAQKRTTKWINDNKIQLIESGDVAVELTRRGAVSDTANPIIGEWMGTTDEYGRKMEIHWFFYPAGQGLFLLPFLTQLGRYATTNSSVEFNMPNESPVDFKYQVKRGILTLMKSEGSGEAHFARY